MSNKMVYQWKSGAQVPVPADIAAREIERVRLKHGGFYKPEHLVDASRPVKAPLHNAFEWDDRIAAERYRIQQAGYLTRCIVRIDPDEPELPPVRAYVSILHEDADEKRTPFYTSIDNAMSRDDLRHQLLANALADIAIFERKYESLEAVAGIIETMRTVRRSISKMTAEIRV
jgi:hypothetical protein